MRKAALFLSLALVAASWPSWGYAAEAFEGPAEAPKTPSVEAPVLGPAAPNLDLPGSVLPSVPELPGALPAPQTLPAASASASAASPSASAAPQAASATAVPLARRFAAVFTKGARLAALAGRSGTGQAAESGPEYRVSAGQAVFDGAAPAAPDAPATPIERFAAKAGYGAGRLLTPGPKVATPFDPDEFGGPRFTKLSTREKIAAGLREGLRLTGVATLVGAALKPLMTVLPWQLWAPDGLVKAAGRVELLMRYGPADILTRLQHSPLSFLAWQAPGAVLYEEAVYRILLLGSVFIGVNAVAAAARGAARGLDGVPDLFNLRRAVQGALGFTAKISAKAFPIAAAVSMASFVAGHFAVWGIDPFTMTVNAVLGLALARLAYRTRSFVAPAVAHLTYDFLALSALAVALHASYLLASGYSLLLSLASLLYLLRTWRARRRQKEAALGAIRSASLARRLAGTLALALALGAAWQGSRYDARVASGKAPAAEVHFVQKDAPSSSAGVAADWAVDVAAKAEPAVALLDVGDGLGSGFIVSPQGLLVTNAHVAESVGLGGTLDVDFANGDTLKAKVIAINRDKDIAFVELGRRDDGKPWPFLPLSAAQPRKGEPVITIGNPLGLKFSVSEGIVSGVGGDGRSNSYVDYVQTDAAINPGNSGGPLLNRQGAVVGMNTWIYADSQNLGFSISARDLITALRQFSQTGQLNSAYLGLIIDGGDMNPPDVGLRVEVVRPGSPAQRAGVVAGDVVLSVQGEKLGDDEDGSLRTLTLALARAKPGDTLRLAVERGEKTIGLSVTLGDKPE